LIVDADEPNVRLVEVNEATAGTHFGADLVPQLGAGDLRSLLDDGINEALKGVNFFRGTRTASTLADNSRLNMIRAFKRRLLLGSKRSIKSRLLLDTHPAQPLGSEPRKGGLAQDRIFHPLFQLLRFDLPELSIDSIQIAWRYFRHRSVNTPVAHVRADGWFKQERGIVLARVAAAALFSLRWANRSLLRWKNSLFGNLGNILATD
jgi:hypothetical protein